jgi:hypothetical protein
MNFRTARDFFLDIKLILILFMFGTSLQTAVSQDVKLIKLEEIPQRKVRNYIKTRSIDRMQEYSSIQPSWKKEIDASGFKIIEKTFFLKFGLSNVWEFYRHASTFKMWNGRSIGFGLLITKCSKIITYAKSINCPEVDTGQVYFLNIKLIKGLINIPVAFQIINIDQLNRTVEFSYIDNNKSTGKQTIQFFDDGAGRTRIVHKSYFKSNSVFRDDWLYPYFHKKFIREFHRNMNKLINNEAVHVAVLR